MEIDALRGMENSLARSVSHDLPSLKLSPIASQRSHSGFHQRKSIPFHRDAFQKTITSTSSVYDLLLSLLFPIFVPLKMYYCALHSDSATRTTSALSVHFYFHHMGI